MTHQSADQRAMWYYNHPSDVDPARLQELRSKDADFDRRLRQLEQQRQPDESYLPPGLDQEDSLVVSRTPAVHGLGRFFFWFFVVISGGLALAFLVWLLFVKDF